MLNFTKAANGNFKSDLGGYELKYNLLAKTWLVRAGTTKIESELKGIASAKESAQSHYDNLTAMKKKEDKTMATIKTRSTTTKTATAKPATVAAKTAKTVAAKPATIVAAKTAKVKTVPPFADFDTWTEENVTLLPVPKGGVKKAGIELQNKKTLQGAKLKFGKERAKYNRENGIVPIITETAVKTPTAVKAPKAVKVKITAGEKHGSAFGGKAFHSFGSVPTELEYVSAQLDNARCSKNYNIMHSRKHPYSTAAKASYLANVERCYTAELHVWETSLDTNTALPKNAYFEYYNSKAVPQELIREPKEGLSVLDGYKMEGFGRLKIGAGIVLPVKLAVPAVRSAKK